MAEPQAAFIGRAAELQRLEAVLARESGAPRIVEVAGEPGIGKSRLLGQACRRAGERGDLLLVGRGAEYERNLPYGLFADALDDYLGSLPEERLAGLDQDVIAELATAFTAFEALAAGRPPAVQAERYRTCRAVRSLLEDLAGAGGGGGPVTLVLDDVHWADPASIDLLLHLLAYPPRHDVVLVVAFRPGWTPSRLATALATGARAGTALRLDLEPFTWAEAEELMGAALGADLKRALYEESGGNPFYLEQLVRRAPPAHTRPPMGSPTGSHLQYVPRAVVEALECELFLLPAAARRLLEGAAVAGDPFEIDLAATAAELDLATALVGLDTLVGVSLVRPTHVARRFRFRHPIVRRAVYEAAGAGQRIDAHARLARALAAAGASPSVLAHHVEHSAAPGDEQAISILIEAAQAASARSPASAAHCYAAALRLLPDGPGEEARQLQLMSKRAVALAAAGDIAGSHAALLVALDRLPPGAPGRVGLIAFCASLECMLGRSDQAVGRLERGLGELTDDGSHEAVTFALELCATAQWSNDTAGVEKWSRRAFEASRHIGEPALEATAAAMSAFAAYDTARVPEGLQHARHAAAIVDRLDDSELAARLDAPYYLGWAEFLLGEFDAALRHVERALAVSRALGQGQWLMALLHAQLWPYIWTGRLLTAEELADAAVEAALVAGDAVFLSMTLYSRGLVATFTGDVPAAIRYSERAVELVGPLDRNASTAFPGVGLGLALIEAGQPERARAEVLAASGGPDLSLLKRAQAMIAYETLVRSELALGRKDAARRWAAEADAMAGRWNLPLVNAAGARSRAYVLLAEDRAQCAAEVVLPAADAVALVSPLESGRTRLLAGRALARAGDSERAMAELGAAEGELAACGARRYAAEAACERTALQRGSPPEATPGVLRSLTARELEIARLVTAGRTNREIAAACHVSEKTVERHLSNIFGKLGIPTRAGLAGIVASSAFPPG